MGKVKNCDKCGERNPALSSVCELKPVRGFSEWCALGSTPPPVKEKKKFEKKPKKKWVKK